MPEECAHAFMVGPRNQPGPETLVPEVLIAGNGALRLPRSGTSVPSACQAERQTEDMKTHEIHSEVRQAQPTAVVTAVLPVAEIGTWLANAFSTLATVIGAHGAIPAGPPFARYHRLPEDRFAVEAGFPVCTAIEADGDVRPSRLPGGPVAVTVHVGSYDEMVPAYEALASWLSSRGGEPAGDPWEVYFSDPGRRHRDGWPPVAGRGLRPVQLGAERPGRRRGDATPRPQCPAVHGYRARSGGRRPGAARVHGADPGYPALLRRRTGFTRRRRDG